MADAGKILIMPKGAYSASTTYEVLDLVYYNGAAWLAKQTVKGITPSSANSAYWHNMLGVMNITYTLTKSGSEIILTGSDGSVTKVTDNNTTYSLGSFGISATAAELNYCDGVTSNIQTQLNNKLAATGTAVAAAKATQDSDGNQINTTYHKKASGSLAVVSSSAPSDTSVLWVVP